MFAQTCRGVSESTESTDEDDLSVGTLAALAWMDVRFVRRDDAGDPARERDKEFLESLRCVPCALPCAVPFARRSRARRSPDPEDAETGGWGLGAGREDDGREDEEDDEENMGWDQAQVRAAWEDGWHLRDLR